MKMILWTIVTIAGCLKWKLLHLVARTDDFGWAHNLFLKHTTHQAGNYSVNSFTPLKIDGSKK